MSLEKRIHEEHGGTDLFQEHWVASFTQGLKESVIDGSDRHIQHAQLFQLPHTTQH